MRTALRFRTVSAVAARGELRLPVSRDRRRRRRQTDTAGRRRVTCAHTLRVRACVHRRSDGQAADNPIRSDGGGFYISAARPSPTATATAAARLGVFAFPLPTPIGGKPFKFQGGRLTFLTASRGGLAPTPPARSSRLPSKYFFYIHTQHEYLVIKSGLIFKL